MNCIRKRKQIVQYLQIFEGFRFMVRLGESSDSAVHTVYERIKGIKGYKMT